MKGSIESDPIDSSTPLIPSALSVAKANHMKTQVSQETDDAIFTLTLQNDATDRFFWLQDKKNGAVYFEAEDQYVGGDAIVKECTVMRDGMHIVLSSGEIVSFYFYCMSLREYLGVVSALKKLYSARPEVLEVFDA